MPKTGTAKKSHKENHQDTSSFHTVCKAPSLIFVGLLHKSLLRLERKIDTLLLSHSPLTLSQYIVLHGLAFCDMSQKEVADHLRITEATVSRHVKALLEKKLIKRETDAKNKKRYIMSATDVGQQKMDEAEKIIKKVADESLKEISEKNLSHLIDVLQKIN